MVIAVYYLPLHYSCSISLCWKFQLCWLWLKVRHSSMNNNRSALKCKQIHHVLYSSVGQWLLMMGGKEKDHLSTPCIFKWGISWLCLICVHVCVDEVVCNKLTHRPTQWRKAGLGSWEAFKVVCVCVFLCVCACVCLYTCVRVLDVEIEWSLSVLLLVSPGVRDWLPWLSWNPAANGWEFV